MTYKVCIFCGSKGGVSERYFRIANKLGMELAKKKFSVIYGGGKHGLMGALADGVIKNNGHLISIIPKHFENKNVLKENSNKIIFTKNFFDRKKVMIESSNIFLVLPGGFGTLDELFEVISLNQLNIIDKKIVLLNINNFWSSLKILIKDLKKSGFLYTKKNIIYKNSVSKNNRIYRRDL